MIDRVTTTPTTERRVALLPAVGVVARRSLTVYRHSPGLLAVTLAAPLGMMLLFGYLFGGALAGGGTAAEYRAFLVPGVLVLVAAMGLTSTAGTANADANRGMSDRLRAMPIRSVTVPLGSAVAEAITGVVVIGAMTGAGLLIGWRIDASAGMVVAGFALLLAFRVALSILGVALGTAIRDPLMLQQVAPLIFGTLMLSNVFVPVDTTPVGLRQVAEWNPISAVVAALRELFGGQLPVESGAWPLREPVAASIVWTIVIGVVGTAIAARSFRVAA